MSKSRRYVNPLLAAKSKVINTQQLGGIETSVLDNGPGRGTRIAWVNTGSGLRYKVVLDRGLDIADAFFGAHSLTWQNLGGITPPTRALDRGLDWLWGFYGGMMVTCGPTHVGAPTTRGGEELGLHGRHSNTAATIESIVNPDITSRRTGMSITGTVRTARVFGPNVEMRRTISSELGQSSINICDTVRNLDNKTVPHAWLLHINFGYPLVDAGTEFLYFGKVTPRLGGEDFFKSAKKYKVVPEPLAIHKGGNEACAFIEPRSDRSKMASVGLHNPKLGLAVEIRFSTKQFPRFVNWQKWGPGGQYVTALEPLHGFMAGTADEADWSDSLRPGQARSYQATITVHTAASDIAAMRRRVAGKK